MEEGNKSAGGILIPDNAAEKPMRGEVIAVGNGKLLDNGKTRTLSVKKGDRILFGKYLGTEVKDGSEYVVMREDDISWPSSSRPKSFKANAGSFA